MPVRPTYTEVKLRMHNGYIKYLLFNWIILPTDAGMNGTTLTTPGACHRAQRELQSPLPIKDNHKEIHIQVASVYIYESGQGWLK